MLLASDFDGTLYVDDINIINKNIKSIKKFRNNGNLFVIITGRGICSVSKLIEKYNIPYDFLICENGAMIFDNNNDNISSTYLNEEDILKIITIIKKHNLKYVFDDGYNYLYDVKYENQKLACIYLDKKTMDDPKNILTEVSDKTNTYSYITKNWINIVNKKINKEKALEKLNMILNNNNEVHVIGDAINDVPMIKKYDGGIIKVHEIDLDSLNNKQYDTLSDYIEELI